MLTYKDVTAIVRDSKSRSNGGILWSSRSLISLFILVLYGKQRLDNQHHQNKTNYLKKLTVKIDNILI